LGEDISIKQETTENPVHGSKENGLEMNVGRCVFMSCHQTEGQIIT
jgi:hypothetical protein